MPRDDFFSCYINDDCAVSVSHHNGEHAHETHVHNTTIVSEHERKEEEEEEERDAERKCISLALLSHPPNVSACCVNGGHVVTASHTVHETHAPHGERGQEEGKERKGSTFRLCCSLRP